MTLKELIIIITRSRARKEVFARLFRFNKATTRRIIIIFACDTTRTNDEMLLKLFEYNINSGDLINYILIDSIDYAKIIYRVVHININILIKIIINLINSE